MAIITKQAQAIAINRQIWLTYLISQNKRLCLWHQRLAHVSNAQVVKVFKLVEGIDLGPTEEYNLVEVFMDSEDLDDSGSDSQSLLEKETGSSSACQIKANTNDNDLLDKLCTPCMGSKLTQVVWRNKSMIPIIEKFEEVHANLWGPHDPPSQFGNTYTAILICEHMRKTWNLYL